MKAGEIGRLCLPAISGYGTQGSGFVLLLSANLIFYVQLRSMKEKG